MSDKRCLVVTLEHKQIQAGLSPTENFSGFSFQSLKSPNYGDLIRGCQSPVQPWNPAGSCMCLTTPCPLHLPPYLVWTLIWVMQIASAFKGLWSREWQSAGLWAHLGSSPQSSSKCCQILLLEPLSFCFRERLGSWPGPGGLTLVITLG